MRDLILTSIRDDSWSGRIGPEGGGDVRGEHYDHCAELESLFFLCVQDRASWIRAFVFVYPPGSVLGNRSDEL